MFGFIANLFALPIVIAADLIGSSGNSEGGGGDGSNYPPSGSDAYSGRWTENEVNIRDNIDAGMAIKEDD